PYTNDFPPPLDYPKSYSQVAALMPYFEQDNLQKNVDPFFSYNNGYNSQYAPGYCDGPDKPGAQIIKILIFPSDKLPNPTVDVYVSGSTTLYLGLSSYGGNAGSHSTYWQPPPGSNNLQDGVFNINSRIRIAEITDGASNTILFGERSHDDPNYKDLVPAGAALETVGAWPWANTLAMEDHTLSADGTKPINWKIPPGNTNNGGYVLSDARLSVFGSGHAGGANFALADGS